MHTGNQTCVHAYRQPNMCPHAYFVSGLYMQGLVQCCLYMHAHRRKMQDTKTYKPRTHAESVDMLPSLFEQNLRHFILVISLRLFVSLFLSASHLFPLSLSHLSLSVSHLFSLSPFFLPLSSFCHVSLSRLSPSLPLSLSLLSSSLSIFLGQVIKSFFCRSGCTQNQQSCREIYTNMCVCGCIEIQIISSFFCHSGYTQNQRRRREVNFDSCFPRTLLRRPLSWYV
jgi:hypothetical protein